MGFTDWQQLGIFPCQDHEDRVPISIRQQLVGGRIAKRPDSATGSSGITEYAKDYRGMGVLGDIHPWFFWQTIDRGTRGMGAMAQAHCGITVEGGTGGFPPGGGTGHRVGPSGLLPIGTGAVTTDGRFQAKYPGWPSCFPTIPQGTMMMVMPGMKEDAQHEVMLHADPRLVAVNTEGPGEAGTLVVDLQPNGEMCMTAKAGPGPRDSGPGIVGRAARLQTMMRVVPLHVASLAAIGGVGKGNTIAWNLALTGVDEMAGYGACWVVMSSGGGGGGGGPTTPGGGTGTPGGPTTPGGGSSGPITHGGGKPAPPGGSFGKRFDLSLSGGGGGGGTAGATIGGGIGQNGPGGPEIGGGFGGGAGSGGTRTAGGGTHGSDRLTPCDFGTFEPNAVGSHGTTFMAQNFACGPLMGGAGLEDKHFMGLDKDGNPLTSGHLSTNSYFYDDSERDGPLLFEGKYPNPPPLPLISRVHLTWDPARGHKWVGGQVARGAWRWYAEYNVVVPDDDEKIPHNITPRGPSGPTTPSGPGPTPPGPTTPGGGGGGRGGKGPRTPGGGGAGGGSTGGSTAPGVIVPSGPKRGPITHGGGAPAPPGPWKGRTYTGTPNAPAPFPGGPGFPTNAPRGPLTPGPNAPLPIPPLGGDPEGGEGTGGPPEGGPGGGGSEEPQPGRGARSDTRHKVGQVMPTDRKLFELFHPMAEGFAQMSFRPPLMVKGQPAYIHNPEANRDDYFADERRRPQVLALRSWGGQSDSGEWVYQRDPDTSRARGGTVHGGVLFSPPSYELEDYFGINSGTDVTVIETASFVACAPGVGFALGQPSSIGGMATGAIVITQLPVGADPWWVYQIDTNGVAQTLLLSEFDTATSETKTTIGGVNSLVLPAGTAAQRPATPTVGAIRTNTDTSPDTVEYWDGAAWTTVPTSGGVSTWIDLTDTDPTAYTSQAGKAVRVNSTPDGLEFIDLDTLYVPAIGGTFTGNVKWEDSDAIQLGTGVDSTILFNGTDTIWDIDANAAGADLRINNGNVGINIDPVEEIHVAGKVRADTAFNIGATDGATQSVEVAAVTTIEFTGGIFTGTT